MSNKLVLNISYYHFFYNEVFALCRRLGSSKVFRFLVGSLFFSFVVVPIFLAFGGVPIFGFLVGSLFFGFWWGPYFFVFGGVPISLFLVGSLFFSFLCCVFVFCFVCFHSVYCVPDVASFSGLSIRDCPLRFSLTFI